MESGYYSDPMILEHCIEMKRLLISSLNTAKKNAGARQPHRSDVP